MWLKVIFIASFCILNVVSRPGGAPLSSCEDMMPRHGANQDQPGNLPVNVEIPTQIISGQPTIIRISGTTSLSSFGGFLIQARAGNNQLIGTFLESEVVGALACRNISGSSATHISMAQKTAVDITWIAPNTTEIIIFNFYVTIAGNFQTFWAARRLPMNIVIPSDPITTTASPTMPTIPTTTQEPPEEPTTPKPNDNCNCNCNCNCNPVPYCLAKV
ncbi:putative defense protein 3 [Chironomus tepperi]|uniref:putative defense protein 3 n=1 Tax=Chironomus tepperi TaxID=113505 RepID=UPI00391F1BD2